MANQIKIAQAQGAVRALHERQYTDLNMLEQDVKTAGLHDRPEVVNSLAKLRELTSAAK